jgi:hypothetical protein
MKRPEREPAHQAGGELQSHSQTTRRRLLALSAGLPFAALAFTKAWADAADKSQACVDPDDMDDGLRKSLHYAEVAPDPQKACAGCSFYTPEAGSGCGHCQIMNGPANAHGHCDSWSPKK